MSMTLSTVMVGTYPPTRCGLATFSENLRTALMGDRPGWRHSVVRIVAPDDPSISDRAEIDMVWAIDDRHAGDRVARRLDRFDVAIVQHEFGIFGGPDGIDVVELAERSTVPLITVLHTVLRSPSARQQTIVETLCDRSAVVVTQSGTARSRLLRSHAVDPGKVELVPHGATLNVGADISPAGVRPTILTWGLIGPGKGIETAIGALASLRRFGVDARYIVAGQTHPRVRAAHGEQYRSSLSDLARSHGVADALTLDDSYRDWESLRALVRSVDVVLLPYESVDQVTSGVLVEALASGKPVVATAFPHAIEMLSAGSGLVVDHRDPEAMALALGRVLTDPAASVAMQRAARRQAGELDWSNVGHRYSGLLERAADRRPVGVDRLAS